MLYLILKELHIVAVVTWIGGMIALALTCAFPLTTDLLLRARRWDQRLTQPAMGLVWTLGGLLTLLGGWIASPWMWAKLVCVLALSTLHGVQAGALRRLTPGQTPPMVLQNAGLYLLPLTVLIVLLVAVKPG